MFGWILPKLLVLGLIIAAIYYVYKWVRRLDRERQDKLREEGVNSHIGRDGEDLVQCTLCGTYGQISLERCPEGHDDCPMMGG